VGCYGLWAVGCYGLWAVGCGLWAVGCGLSAEQSEESKANVTVEVVDKVRAWAVAACAYLSRALCVCTHMHISIYAHMHRYTHEHMHMDGAIVLSCMQESCLND